MMISPMQLPYVHHNASCEVYAHDAEENRIRKESLVSKT